MLSTYAALSGNGNTKNVQGRQQHTFVICVNIIDHIKPVMSVLMVIEHSINME